MEQLIKERLEVLKRSREQVAAQLNAIMGAIAEFELLLNAPKEEPVVPRPKQPRVKLSQNKSRPQ